MNSPAPNEHKRRKSKRSSSKRRVWLFRLVAISFPLVVLLVAELALRLVGTGYPTAFLVPHPTKPGVLVDNYKFAWRYFSKALARTPQPIVVERQKPKDTFRIIVFGGSAAMGDPEPAYGMPRVLEVLLSAKLPSRKIEVVNCGVTAINSHVVRDIARDCRQLDADAWVVYLGNNEVHGPFGAGTVFGSHDKPLWLNRLMLTMQKTKLGQLTAAWRASGGASETTPKKWGGMKMFLEQTVEHDDPELQRVYANFAKNLRAIANAADSQTSVLISSVATNLKDFPPFVSKSAEEEFEQAQQLVANGESSAALERFKAARDHDTLRFRADSMINEAIASVAAESNAHFVDANSILAEASPGGINGDEHFHEHVHLTFAGNYRLGLAFADKLVDVCSAVLGEAAGSDRWLSKEECASALGLSPFHERLTLQDVRGRLSSPPFDSQLGHAERSVRLAQEITALTQQMTPAAGQETMAKLAALIDQRPDDWMLRRQYALLLDSIGDLPGAAKQYELVAELLPHNAESQFRLGAQYNRLKERGKAEVSLRKALELRPDFVRAYNSLGICLSHQQRFDEAYEAFRQATDLQPTFGEAHYNWGMVLEDQGDQSAAMAKYAAAAKVEPNNLQAHMKLGKSFVALNKLQDAMPHYESVARLMPGSEAAQLNLGMLYLKSGGHAEQAKTQFQRTLEINPTNAEAKQGLRMLQSAGN